MAYKANVSVELWWSDSDGGKPKYV